MFPPRSLPVSFHQLEPPLVSGGTSRGGPPAWSARAYAPLLHAWPRFLLTVPRREPAPTVEVLYKAADLPDEGWEVMNQGALPDYLEPEIRAVLAEAAAAYNARKADSQ